MTALAKDPNDRFAGAIAQQLSPEQVERSQASTWPCIGYLVHLFGKIYRKSDRAYLHSLHIDVGTAIGRGGEFALPPENACRADFLLI
jgi:hypothetical protein